MYLYEFIASYLGTKKLNWKMLFFKKDCKLAHIIFVNFNLIIFDLL